MRVIIDIAPRKGQLDPQGSTIKDALTRLGYGDVSHVQWGKQLTLTLADMPAEQARRQIEKMCEELLASPITERYSIRIVDEKG